MGLCCSTPTPGSPIWRRLCAHSNGRLQALLCDVQGMWTRPLLWDAPPLSAPGSPVGVLVLGTSVTGSGGPCCGCLSVPGLWLAHTYEGPFLSCGLGLGDTLPAWTLSLGGCQGLWAPAGLSLARGLPTPGLRGGSPDHHCPYGPAYHSLRRSSKPASIPPRGASASRTATARATARQQSPPRVWGSPTCTTVGKAPMGFLPGGSRQQMDPGNTGITKNSVKFCEIFVKNKLQFLFKQKKAKIKQILDDEWCLCSFLQSHTHTPVHTHARTCAQADMLLCWPHPQTRADTCTHSRVHTCRHAHTCGHTRRHTHTQMHAHNRFRLSRLSDVSKVLAGPLLPGLRIPRHLDLHTSTWLPPLCLEGVYSAPRGG